ncbi:cadherin-related tumor suppressor-like [Tigriopus californicus]|uniref:cadherin-related tumor suppressor-like n=1 Tax=Tigriopus californicus TaxID=6832 RepID=UPI0027DAA62D|nr:cadherin-related tumor suppressor-like [Tigriopus californicus]
MWKTVLLTLVGILSLAVVIDSLEVSFSEGAIAGTRRLLEISPEKSSPNVKIVSGNDGGHFRIHRSQEIGSQAPNFVYIETTRAMDREERPSFDLLLETSDQDRLKLHVNILDINDNPPKFAQEEYQAFVNKTSPPGTPLITLKAVDVDDGRNAEISYHMSEGFDSYFVLDRESGQLRTRKLLSCSKEAQDHCLECLEMQLCSIVIYAKDGGQPQQSAYTVVKVKVLNSNEFDPEITIRYFPDQSQDFAALSPHVEPGTSVAALTVVDRDRGAFGETTLEIVGSDRTKDKFVLSALSQGLYVLRVGPNAQNLLGSDGITLTVEAKDKGKPPRSTQSQVKIQVNEANNHAPEFAEASYSAEIRENADPNSQVITVQAFDKDSDAQALVYSIENGNDYDWFKVEPFSGMIVTKSKLDRELKDRFNLTVRAQDLGIRPKSALVLVEITVLDVNDEVPQFENLPFLLTLSEDISPGSEIFTVNAFDRDSKENGTITLTSNTTREFEIDPDSGVITLRGNLDRETKDKYFISIEASDGGGLTTSSILTLLLDDVNDNSPEFYPNVIVQNVKVGRALEFALKAHDPDKGENAQLHYEWVQPTSSLISLNETTGIVTLDKRFRSFPLRAKITCSDQGGRKSRNEAEIVLQQLVYEEPLQVFQRDVFTFEIVEDGRGSFAPRQVGGVANRENTEPGKFAIIDGDFMSRFLLDPESGILSTKAEMDREEQEQINLTIAFFPENERKRVPIAKVAIALIDVNDHAPEFTDLEKRVISFTQVLPENAEIYKVKARDLDQDLNGQIKFALSDPTNTLAIHGDSGVLVLNQEVRSVFIDDFVISVTVSDQGTPSKFASRDYTIQVVAQNLHTPQFDFPLYEVTVSEALEVNSKVFQLVARDKDSGSNGHVTTTIINGAQDYFGIFPHGGIYLKQSLDRETQAFYSIDVLAEDHGIPKRTAHTKVVIYVQDENDNYPQFDRDNYVFYVREGEVIGTNVGRVMASDKDIGRNAELRYAFASTNNNNIFIIDEDTGFINTAQDIDRERLVRETGQDYFVLEVSVSDLGVSPLSDTAVVNVVILDVNDNAPTLSEEIYRTNVKENVALGTVIYTMYARDYDKEENGRLTFSLENSEYFQIESETGDIFVSKDLDREDQERHEFLIFVKDGGEPPLNSSAKMIISVLDENDNDPKLEFSHKDLEMSESFELGSIIHTFTAVDLDAGDNARVKFVLGGTNHRHIFHLDENTGILSLKEPLDRESIESLSLTISAIDGGLPSRTATATINISVSDENDNTPTFPPTTYLFSVTEGVPEGSSVFKVQARDEDQGQNGNVSYELLGTQDFRIDPLSGDVSTAVLIDREITKEYQFTIRAKDHGAPEPKYANKDITVMVEDVNDHAPEFDSLTTKILMPGSFKGTHVLQIHANDLDASNNGQVVYSLQKSSLASTFPFELNRTSGRLSLSRDVLVADRDTYSLSIIASDEAVQSVRKSATSSVLIISGHDEAGPDFTQVSYSASISENSPLGTPVVTVKLSGSGKDFDFYINACVSKFGSDRGLFLVDKRSGQIRSNLIIDRELEGDSIELEVVAVSKNKISKTKVSIEVLDENDSAPRFVQDMPIKISEAFLAGHNLGQLKAIDEDKSDSVTYKIGVESLPYLEVNADSGELFLTSPIDREEFEYFEVVVLATDGQHTTTWRKNLKVEDVNDNAPEFVQAFFSFDINESAKPGAVIGRLKAVDRDQEAKFRDLTYHFNSEWGRDTFTLDPKTGVIILSGALDFETIEHYVLMATAVDGGQPALTASTTVYINVVDINDNKPVLKESVFEVNLLESVPVGSLVTKITAIDKDTGSENQLEFSFEETDQEYFSIDDDGVITTKSVLDREKIPFYSLHVSVRDGRDSSALTASAIVHITIEDVNDEVPRIVSPPVLHITENAPPNSPIATIQTVDKDVGENAEVHYFLEDSISMRFAIGRIDGVLRSLSSLDREIESSYLLTIKAIDNGIPSLSSSMQVRVEVTDENDNSPVFSPKFYSAKVLENAIPGSVVIEAQASDLDVGKHAELRYSIVSGDSDLDFRIDEQTGLVIVNKRLDYERKNLYELTIQSQDGGIPSQVDTATVVINILDVNDNAPEFVDSPYFVMALENYLDEITPIFTLTATDKDDPPFNRLEFGARDDFNGVFHVNSSTGEIFLKQALDREERNSYTLEVTAIDFGTPRLTATGLVEITVQDINDNEPQFEHDRYSFDLEENLPAASFVGLTKAYDDDFGYNAKVRYHLEETHDFSIDQWTGEIKTNRYLDRERKSVHEFKVIATDQSEVNPLSATAQVSVKLLDVNDNSPKIENDKSEFYIPPGLSPGDFIFGIFASDADSGDNAELRFSLRGRDSRYFDMDPVSGVGVASKQFQEKFSYQVIVVVSDSGFNSLSTEEKFEIFLAKELVVPSFSSPIDEVDVDEDSPLGMELAKFASVEKTGVAFGIAGGNTRDSFWVNATTGALEINQPLDFEDIREYDLWIKLHFQAKPLFFTTTRVKVNVRDKNDNAPTFENTVVRLKVPEEQYPPFQLMEIFATDLDNGVNGEISYQLLEPSTIFEIDTNHIICKERLDREKTSMYHLKLLATDHGVPRMSSTASVLIEVEDINDNAPLFTRLYAINVTENTPNDKVLLKVETRDADSPPNANVSYSLLDQGAYQAFQIESQSGELSTIRKLDREIQEEHYLQVQASDGAWKLDTTITVTVLDENDNWPVFDQDNYEFVYPISNEIKLNSKIGRVHALDRDSPGPNSDIVYSLSHSSEFFQLDGRSGQLSVRSALPFTRSSNSDNIYQLRVLATDLGSPPRSSECQVRVKVLPKNQNLPKFEAGVSPDIAIPKSLPRNSIITTVNAEDPDGDQITFSVVNGKDSFAIGPTSGTIRLLKSSDLLGTENIILRVKATDNGSPPLSSETQITIYITDENRHAPAFPTDSLTIFIREDETIGNVIATVNAEDSDDGPNGQVEYSIVKGNDESKFEVGSKNGEVRVKGILDYETIKEFVLTIRAKDLAYHSKSTDSQVKIVLQDVNDHAPEFKEAKLRAFIRENSKPDSFVTQLNATDQDSDKFAQIEFKIMGDESRFEIDRATGVILTKDVFDYETESGFNLTVIAYNPGSKMQSKARLLIQVLGENEFIPKFKQPVFQFVISESSQVGNSVGFVEASDDDLGPEGDVFYYFVGISNMAGFGINHNTGEIFVNDELDRESQNRYVLTVLAKNRGSIRGNDIDEAQVIIQVQDGNDPPVFRKNQYQANVREDLSPGSKVVTVSAVDKDVRPRNSHFSYSLGHQDGSDGLFEVNPTSGVVKLTASLDRETQSIHKIQILAIDSGSPPATGTAMLTVTVEDINDTPPKVTNTEGFIKENSPPESFIMKFKVIDADLEENGPPFRFRLLPNRFDSYVSLNEASGVLKSTKTFDREMLPKFEIDIEVSDSGNPSQLSVNKITVNVMDENDNPSSSRNVVVVIKSYEGIFPGGKVVDIRPNDPDEKGDYACSLIRGSNNIFQVKPNCEVSAGRIQNGRQYELAIEVNDGRHPDAQVNARLNFVPFTRSALDEAVTIRFKNVSTSNVLGFFESHNDNGDARSIQLLSVSQDDNANQDFIVSLTENDQSLSEPNTLAFLASIFNRPNEFFDLNQATVKFEACDDNPCKNGGSCLTSLQLTNQTSYIELKDTIYNTPEFKHNIKCICSEKYLGNRCQIQTNPCDPSPCLYNGQCFKDGSDFQCLCPPKRGGRRCEEERLDVCEPSPCLHGGTCQHSDSDSFFCLCRPGYQGDRCQDFIDVCRKNPCLNGGTCVSLKPNYKCRCLDNFYGNHCELSTFGFEEFSFAAFPALGAVTNDLSIIFSTTKPNSLLVYNYGPSLGGRSDFFAIELINGTPRLSWGGARTAISRLEIPKRLDTGRWFRITATRNNRVGTLSIEDCTESGEFCKTCHPDDNGCFKKAVGDAGALAFHGNNLFLGGLPDLTSVLDKTDQIGSTDFVGCIKSISIGGNEKSILGKSVNASGITSSCNQWAGGACQQGNECGSEGQCIPHWSKFKCQCGDILADNCDHAFQPFSLTEEQEVVFRPKEKYRRHALLKQSLKSSLFRWKRDLGINENGGSMGIAFRTLKTEGSILTAHTLGSWTSMEIQESKLVYRSHLVGKPEINMTSGLDVTDGDWHQVSLDILDGVLRIDLDGKRVGYEIDASAVHDFLGPGLERFVLGNAAESTSKGFRGCFSNFTLNDELQSLTGDSQLEADVPNGIVTTGCDIQILQSAQPQNAVDVGVTIVIVFFVILICTILISFTVFRLRKKWKEDKERDQFKNHNNTVYTGEPGYNNGALQLQEPMPLNNTIVHPSNQYKSKIRRPDMVEPPSSLHHQLNPVVDDPLYNSPHNDPSAAEHYDLENASSIAPSDIDIVYHYKGYRNGNRHRGKSPLSPFHKKQGGSKHQNTPLARLSPSSEMSHNTPRILTLGDLSGKPMPPTLMSEQSERSLHSPISHLSSSRSSRHRSPRSRHQRGLTSENVARFNQHSVTPPQKSTLVNTLDMVGMGSEALKKSDYGSKSPTLGDVQSSSSSDNENDSFTCSEYEYESVEGREVGGAKEVSDASMVFSKLIGDQNALSDEDEDNMIPPPPPPPHHNGLSDQSPPNKTWESLLSWQPSYKTFSGVFRDIAELPFTSNNLDLEESCRPRPIGDGSRTEQEQYI